MGAQRHQRWRVASSEFETSASRLSQCPPADVPEVAFSGRSNVGKSSLLNALVGRRGLARVGRTPGRTQLLNFFRVELRRGEEIVPMRIVDLPGYGYAATSREVSRGFGPMIQGYLTGRDVLKALGVLIDARRGADARDLDLLELAAGLRVPCLLVVTKVDKLGASQRGTLAQKIAKSTGAHSGDVLLTSASAGIGIEDDPKHRGLVADLADLARAEHDAEFATPAADGSDSENE